MGRILLVRHGQASWGSDDYDRLSDVGHAQARRLGEVLAARGVMPAGPHLVVRGAMRRHRETCEGLLAGAGWGPGDAVEVDRGWDEFDHVEVLGRHPAPWGAAQAPDRESFGAWFDAALARWTDGEHDEDYAESFASFSERVLDAVRRLADRLGPDDLAVVVTSGGPVGRTVAGLVGGEDLAPAESGRVWRRLNVVLANGSLTTVATRSAGSVLVTYNEHSYLGEDLLTFR